MKAAIFGFGKSGQAIARFLLNQNADVFVFDENLEIAREQKEVNYLIQSGVKAYSFLEAPKVVFQLGIISPGFSENHAGVAKLSQCCDEIIGEMEFGLRHFNGRCVGITGTNGKTTVTSMIAHILNYNKKEAIACGNIGLPLIEAQSQNSNAILVIEMSSFQLDRIFSKKLDSALLLNITPDHLDRYATFQDYAFSKSKIAKLIKESGSFYVHDKTLNHFQPLFENKKAITYGLHGNAHITIEKGEVVRFCKKETSLLKLLENCGNHDKENILAAYAISRDLGLTPEAIREGIETFKKPSHRIEFVKEINGVRFFDDSKGTNLDAVCQAVDTMKGEVILIAGGVDKGAPYTPWIEHFQDKVKEIFAIGQAASKIQSDLTPFLHVKIFNNLEKAVLEAFQRATPGSNILLSPGCSSYDMFRDYAERGNEFKRIVNTITNEIKL